MSDLPQGWRWKPIGDLAEIAYGKGLPQRERHQTGRVPVFGSNGKVGNHDTPKTEGQTIIIGRKGSIGAVHFSPEPCWPIDTTYFIDSFHPSLFPEYLFLFLRMQNLSQLDRSAAIPGIRREDIYRIEIPLPSLEEQHRIVARIEELTSRLEEAKALRHTAVEEAEAIIPAALVEVFKVAEAWKQTKIGAVLKQAKSGFACSKKHMVDAGVIHLRTNNIGLHGELDLSQIIYLPRELVDTETYSLQAGDVLFNNTNSVELVGKAAIVHQDCPYAFSNHITRLRVDTDKITPDWLLLCLRQLWFESVFAKGCRRWIGQAGFNPSMLMKLAIPLPSLEEQRQIVAHMDRLRARVGELRPLQGETQAELYAMTQAILAKAFRGEF